MADSHPQFVKSEAVAKAFMDAGIIDGLDGIRRIVVDLQAGEPAKLYVERFGDDRLLNVAMALDGVEVSSTPADEISR